MNLRPRRFRTPLLVLAGLVLAWLLLTWLVLPALLQSQAGKYIAERTGHRLEIGKAEFNPLQWRLLLQKVALSEPDGKPLLAFDDLVVDLSAASISRLSWVFDEIRVAGLAGTLAVRAGDRLNWSDFIARIKAPDDTPDTALPRLDIRSLVISASRLDIADGRTAKGFTTRIEPIDLELSELTTLPDEKGQIKVAARTSFGAKFQAMGKIGLNPLALAGDMSVADVDLARLAVLFGAQMPVALLQGSGRLAADFRFTKGNDKVELTLDKVTAGVSGLRLQREKGAGPALALETVAATGGRFDLGSLKLTVAELALKGAALEATGSSGATAGLLQIDKLAVGEVRVDLAGRSAAVTKVAISQGRLQARRNAQGRVDLMDFIASLRPAAPKPADNGTKPTQPWRYRIDRVELAGFSADLRDETVKPAAELALEDVTLSIDGVSEDMKQALPMTFSTRARDGGNFEAAGKFVPSGAAADFKVKLDKLSLVPMQPYLAQKTVLKLRKGAISSEGRLLLGGPGPSYRGSFALRDLDVVQTGSEKQFLGLKSLATNKLSATSKKLDVADLAIDGLDTELIIDKDKSINLTKIFGKRGVTAKADAAPTGKSIPPAAKGTPATGPAQAPYEVNIDRLRLTKSKLDFADNSLLLPFAARIHDLRGAIGGLSTRPGARAQIELDGQVNEFGLARAVGQMEFGRPGNFTDLKVVFRNIEMTRLTPYAATFAGRKINSGKLSLDLEYKIIKRQLQGENKVVMEKLTLGDKVDSPGAQDLPLDFAIAILQDADGRIDLGLPVSGSLDDPQFSYSQIIWKAIGNVIGNIVSAPFRALAALFGGNEKFEKVSFEAGRPGLTPPEREKILHLAEALKKRPGLALEIHGVYADSDRTALQDLHLRQAIAARAGLTVAPQGDPGPMSATQPTVQKALASLYAERFGRQALATLGASESVSSKSIDINDILMQRLRDNEKVSDDELRALAKVRADNLLAGLLAAGAAADRVSVGTSEKVDAGGREIPVKLVLRAAAKN